MHNTLFTSLLLRPFFAAITNTILFLLGWKTTGEKPTHDKYVLIAAPHTSNWDLFFTIAFALKFKVNVYWMGKDSIFMFPFKSIMMYLGGIPVDRSKAHNMVQSTADEFANNDKLIIAVPPEGTRGKSKYWKTGFYHIAFTANVPICLGYLDYAKKEASLGATFHPTGDIDKDMIQIAEYYKDIKGKYSDKFTQTEIRKK